MSACNVQSVLRKKGQLCPRLRGTVEPVRPIQSPPSTPLAYFMIHRCKRTYSDGRTWTRLRTTLIHFQDKEAATRESLIRLAVNSRVNYFLIGW